MILVCPKPFVWHPIYMRLREQWQSNGCCGSEPPVPLILAGWHFSSDLDKQQRWHLTLKWAEERGLSHLTGPLSADEQYFTDCLTTSYPEQHYRPDRLAVRERPSAEALATALEVLKSNWQTIAGEELSAACKPISITGRKGRRLLVRVHREFAPPWGTWNNLSAGPEREGFTTLRKRINDAIVPVYVDHVDFDVGVAKTP